MSFLAASASSDLLDITVLLGAIVCRKDHFTSRLRRNRARLEHTVSVKFDQDALKWIGLAELKTASA
jgi:hypothetical protein